MKNKIQEIWNITQKTTAQKHSYLFGKTSVLLYMRKKSYDFRFFFPIVGWIFVPHLYLDLRDFWDFSDSSFSHLKKGKSVRQKRNQAGWLGENIIIQRDYLQHFLNVISLENRPDGNSAAIKKELFSHTSKLSSASRI